MSEKELLLLQVRGDINVTPGGAAPQTHSFIGFSDGRTDQAVRLKSLLVVAQMSYFRKLEEFKYQPVTPQELQELRGKPEKGLFIVPVLFVPDMSICTSGSTKDLYDKVIEVSYSSIISSFEVAADSLFSRIHSKTWSKVLSSTGMMYQSIMDSLNGADDANNVTDAFFEPESQFKIVDAVEPTRGMNVAPYGS